MSTLTTFAGGSPPFAFDGVIARTFPLRANLPALQRFCDCCLNWGDRSKAWFRPAAPYVYFCVLNYGRMQSTKANEAHYGWVAQNEVFFAVPLAWGRDEGGRWVFQDWATVCPFIFVDQAWSVEVGREVFGWPKEEARFEREITAWAGRGPAEREQLLTISVETFDTPYAGERADHVVLVEIEREPPLDVSSRLWQAPLEVYNPLFAPLTFTREMVRWWSSPSLVDTAAAAARAFRPTNPYRPDNRSGSLFPPFSTINLKQARDLARPDLAVYKAVTAAPMQMLAMRRAGGLGEARFALGDPTGGYRIKVHRHPVYPIVETLGLVTSDEDRHVDDRDNRPRGTTVGTAGNTWIEPFPAPIEDSGGDVQHSVTLAPLFPFWLEGDLEYGKGITVVESVPRAGYVVPGRGAPHYDATWDARSIPAPPYDYPNLTARLLALPASRATLQALLDDWFRETPVGRLELFPLDATGDDAFVLLMITTSDEMSAGANDVGRWWRRKVDFHLPVRWTPPGAADGCFALVTAIAFADSAIATNVSRDFGSYVVRGHIHAPPDAWLGHRGPEAGRHVLWLTTEALPALDVDAEAEERLILEILEPGHNAGAPDEGTGPADVRDGLRFPVLGIRVIRSASDPDQLAYQEWFTQELIAYPPKDEPWWRCDRELELRIHSYPGRLDLVKNLGLREAGREYVKATVPGRGFEGTTVAIVKPIVSVWSTYHLTHATNTPRAIWSRDGWQRLDAPPPTAHPRLGDLFDWLGHPDHAPRGVR